MTRERLIDHQRRAAIQRAKLDILVRLGWWHALGYLAEANAKNWPNGELYRAAECYLHASHSNWLYESSWRLNKDHWLPEATQILRLLNAGALLTMEAIRLRDRDSNLADFCFDMTETVAIRIAFLKSKGYTAESDDGEEIPDDEDK